MAIVFIAPFDSPQDSIVLPNPQFGDTIAPKIAMTIKQTMDGNKRTYVKNAGGWYELTYMFQNVTRLKTWKFKQFILMYSGVYWQLFDNYDVGWRCVLKSNPLQFSSDSVDLSNCYLERDSFKIELEAQPI